MSRRLDIGVASYGANHQQLRKTLESIVQHSTTDWRCFVVHNPSPGDEMTREVICGMADRDRRFVPVWNQENVGYAGAVNVLLQRAETETIAYCDNDAEVNTPGWDEKLCGYLDRFHELAMVFPNGGAYMLNRGGYTEILWGVGFCWVTTRLAASEIGEFDTSLGHQDEVDWQTRARLAGYRIAAAPEVSVSHRATATNNPAAIERINRGVVRWVEKWVKYFGGKHMGYHSPNVLRFEDWDVNRLFLEDWFKEKLPGLNDNPETVTIEGRQYDLLKSPHFKDFYKGRIL